ncbi:beta-1,4-N-acetylgalactosaminyltransferase bre-4-like [Bacillus rossius redtenbacheri]|uniref:beta-1,4-N-acetylgalactosaminyltransferase bre-4-like n=1 Tax=Bacillus rossius redtenbacheri TaxID=93214 RepID=UPI002FDD3957
MALLSCLRSCCCKSLMVLVGLYFCLQYLFSGMFEPHRLEPLFLVNSSHARLRVVRPRATPPPPAALVAVNGTPPAAGTPSPAPASSTPAAVAAVAAAAYNSTTPTPESGRPECPAIPPDLQGPVKVVTEAPPLEELERMFPSLLPGGRYRPSSCRARDRVAVVVPFRDRAQHLAILLRNLHPVLQRQQLDYGVYVIEQAGDGPFNRAMLMNVGFVEALKQYSYDCFVFHDVDLLPEDDRNLYNCPEQPRHMSVAVDSLKYRLPYDDIFGGVSAMTKAQFEKVNGFSNMYWGWGAEDDDMSNRIKYHGYHISRYPANVARYRMLTHHKQRANPKRYEYLHAGRKRFLSDGLSDLKYRRLRLELPRLYTHVLVEVEAPS